MRDIRTYFTNPFNAPDISMTELLAFATDHLGRLGAQNSSGEWNARIGATSAALATLDGAFSDDLSQAGARKARKLAKNNFRKTLGGEVAKVTNFVEAHFGKGSPEIKACLPKGLAVFGKAPDDAVKNHLDTVIAGAQAVEATIGSAKVTEAVNLKASWMAIYEASEGASADKSLTEAEKRAARTVLQDELFVTLLDLAKKFRDQPEQVGLFMQPHLAGGAPIGSAGTSGGGSGGESSSSGTSSSSSSSTGSFSSSSSSSSSSSMSSSPSSSSSSTGSSPSSSSSSSSSSA